MRSQTVKGAALSLAALTALTMTGCSKADGGSASSGGDGIEAGATMEDYQAAFADIDPIELDFQVASPNPEAYASLRDREFAESLEEWSDGKITVNIHYSGAIAAPTEVPAALADGRLDLAHYYTTYEPQEMPSFVDMTSSMVQVPSTPLVGEIVTHAALQEVSFNSPEIMEEFTSRGLYPINPANPNGNISMVCNSERTEPADFKGAQIRGNAEAHQKEVEALGGTVASIELAEGYEAFQRGILDCSLQSTATALAMGWLEVAPHVYYPQEQSFAPGPGSLVAGAVWEQLPLVAQQLMFDLQTDYTTAELYNALESIRDNSEAAAEAGGEAGYLDEESEAALSEANDGLLDSVAESDTIDGEGLNTAVADSVTKWQGIAEELGYTDDGGFEDFPDWYQGSADFDDRSYLEPIAEAFYEEIVLPNRPS
jgi:TRAP-type C4-dicarboxylate transport system substrate-binding protein